MGVKINDVHAMDKLSKCLGVARIGHAVLNDFNNMKKVPTNSALLREKSIDKLTVRISCLTDDVA